MKRINAVLIIILLVVMAGCGKKQSTDDLIIVDVTKSYPKKELILQDFLDVEYILLDDTNDEFVTNGLITHIGKEIILARNMGTTGDILVFDRYGKGLRVINRKGQGGEEYPSFGRANLDEDNSELFVYGSRGNIMVYDMFGKFKRSLPYKEIASITLVGILDKDYLIINTDISNYETKNSSSVISKQDGSVVKEIQIPYNEKKTRVIYEGTTQVADGPRNQELIPNRDSWIVMEVSSDTIYQLFPDYRMIPFMVRTPSVQSMEPEIFLYPSVLTHRYYFMQAAEKTATRTESGTTYPRRDLVYDRHDRSLFEYVVYNDDYSTKRSISLAFESINQSGMPFLNNEIAFYRKIESYELVEAYEKGELKDGKLKEIAAQLNPESNPVIMIAKHKK